MKKKIAVLIMAGLLCICFAGCTSENVWRTDTLNGISYSAPQNWDFQEGGNFRSYTGVDGSGLLVTAIAEGEIDFDTAYESFTTSMADKIEEKRHEVSIAGESGVSYIVRHKADKTALKSELTFFQMDGTVYIVAITCPEKSFSQYGEIYRTIIDSVQRTEATA